MHDLMHTLDVNVFEVDKPELQKSKRTIIDRRYKYDQVPRNIKYVSTDFNMESDGLLKALQKEGFDTKKQVGDSLCLHFCSNSPHDVSLSHRLCS